MDDHIVNSWIASSGFSKEKCAMIQPKYGAPAPVHIENINNNYIDPAYGIFIRNYRRAQLFITQLTEFKLPEFYKTKVVPVIALLVGAGQLKL